MTGHKESGPELTCERCVDSLQEYLDGTLDKTHSLQVFLHLRECAACSAEHEALQGLFSLLGELPQHEVPAGFDQAVLASVPYEAYRAMEPLRRQRVPVFLDEEALPALVRNRAVRLAGLGAALSAAVWQVGFQGPAVTGYIVGLGVLPEALVLLQSLGRKAVLSVRRAEG